MTLVLFVSLNRCFRLNHALTVSVSFWASPLHLVPNCLLNVVRKECHLGVVSISRIASRNGQRRFYNLPIFLLRISASKADIVPAIRFSVSEQFVSLPRQQNQNLLEARTENHPTSNRRKRNRALPVIRFHPMLRCFGNREGSGGLLCRRGEPATASSNSCLQPSA
jgi:hypothetical protein